MNTRGIKLILMLIFSLVLIPTVAGQLNVTFDNPLLPRVILNAPAGPSIPPLNGTFNQTLTDLLYWKLDGSNDPPTSDWNMDTFGFTFQNLLTSRIAPCGNVGLCLTSAIIRLVSNVQIMGDTVNDNVTILFTGSPTNLNGTIRYDTVANQFNIDRNLSVVGFYFGNGSQLTDLCKSNGSDCQSVVAADQNLTNVAFLNETQNFTGVNTFTNITVFSNFITQFRSLNGVINVTSQTLGNYQVGFDSNVPDGAVFLFDRAGGSGASIKDQRTFEADVDFDINVIINDNITIRGSILGTNRITGSLILAGNLTSPDLNITIADGVDISFLGLDSCINFDSGIISTSDAFICTMSNLLTFGSPVITLNASTLRLGSGGEDDVGLLFDVSGVDATLDWVTSISPNFWNLAQPFHSPTWFGSTLPSFFRNNISWVGADGSELLISVPIVRIHNGGLNVSTDVCIEGGNCLSQVPASVTDTNATTECSGDEVLLGNSSCATITGFLDAHGIAYLSVSTTSHSNSGVEDVEIYPFASTNYTAYTYVNNSNPSDITYDSLTGQFNIGFTGVLDYSWNGIWHNLNNYGVNVTVRQDGVNIFQNDIQDRGRTNIGDDPRASFSVGQIIDVNNGDILEFFWELVDEDLIGGPTTEARSGNTVNMRRLS